jgi:hypothetical protein
MVQDRERIEEPETDRLHNEQIHRGDPGVVAGTSSSSSPVAATPHHVLGNRGLSHIDAELQQQLTIPTARSKTQLFARAIKRLQSKIGEPAARRRRDPALRQSAKGKEASTQKTTAASPRFDRSLPRHFI